MIRAVVGAEAGLMSFFDVGGGGLSTCDRQLAKKYSNEGFVVHEILVPSVTLDNLFEQSQGREIHWLKIDVEGSEKEVLQGWRKSDVRPWIVILERTLRNSQITSHQKWESMILRKGYKFAYFDGLNRFYIAAAHANLLSAFAVGPNVFDGFAVSGVAWSSWCKVVNETMHASESKRESERLAYECRETQSAAASAKQRQRTNAELERITSEFTLDNESIRASLEAAKKEASDAVASRAAAELAAYETLLEAQSDAMEIVNKSAIKERELAGRIEEGTRAPQAELVSSAQETARSIHELAEKESSLLKLQAQNDQILLTASHSIALLELKLGAEISAARADLEQRDNSLSATKDAFETPKISHEKLILNSTQTRNSREKEHAKALLEIRQQADSLNARHKQDHDATLHSLLLAHQKQENSLLAKLEEFQKQQRETTQLLLQREQEFSLQLLSSKEQNQALHREHGIKMELLERDYFDREQTLKRSVSGLEFTLRAVETNIKALKKRWFDGLSKAIHVRESLRGELRQQCNFRSEIQHRLVMAEHSASTLQRSFA